MVQGRCSDYYLLETGFLHPENKDLPFDKDSFQLFGYFDQEQKLLGFVDVLTHYPQINDWHIGLMVFIPEARGQGYGTKLLAEIIQEARLAGVERLFVAPLEVNKPALQFWGNHGFLTHEIIPNKTYGTINHTVYHLCKVL